MKKTRKIVVTIISGFVLSACAVNQKTYTIQIHPSIKKPKSVKQIALFLDGTQNDRDSRTDVSALSEILKHQDKDNLYIFYNEGVGTDGKFIGAGTGLGIDKDVAEAYAFLTQYYSVDSKLYIFGFSRGAYTSRILAGMIFSVGIYDLTQFNKEDRYQISKELYGAYKGKNKSTSEIRKLAEEVVKRWADKIKPQEMPNHKKVPIEILGLWDTVEALGVVPSIEAGEEKILGIKDPQNMVNPNKKYIDQICNVKNVFQALSLDDNRANVFTPIIISSEYVVSPCDADHSEESAIEKVDEVWFSGAHADVGGGYKKMRIIKKEMNPTKMSLYPVFR